MLRHSAASFFSIREVRKVDFVARGNSLSYTNFLISRCLTSGFAILICGVLATWRLGRSDFEKS